MTEEKWAPHPLLIDTFADIIKDTYDEDSKVFAENLLIELNERGYLSR
jgi:hypothetical protein